MSLPSNVKFKDANGRIVAFGACNIGWYIDLNHVPECIREGKRNAEIAAQIFYEKDENLSDLGRKAKKETENEWLYLMQKFPNVELLKNWKEVYTTIELYGLEYSRDVLEILDKAKLL